MIETEVGKKEDYKRFEERKKNKEANNMWKRKIKK